MKLLNNFHERFVLAGKVIGVHGIRGVIKFNSFVEQDLLTPGNLFFYHSTDHQINRISILSVKPNKRIYLITLEGVTDRTQAEAFVGIDIYIERMALPELDSDTYYWFEIQGLDVVDISGIHRGVVRSIMETGGNDVYVIEHNGTEYLIPAITSVVKKIDIDQNQMIVDIPEGIISDI
ncbi:MAG: 16S rRNA processing protein RimM [Candidatus Magnetomorum sp.]|nr:16S rRNA processing protein RimM [Candidatus Magnetomorum sp.]